MITSGPRIGVLDLGRPTLANAIRAGLEEIGIGVHIWRALVPSDLFGLVESGPTAPDYVVICADADAGGIVFPRVASEFDLDVLKHGRLPFSVLRERVFLPHKVVIGAGPGLGHPDCAQAFLDGGAAAYFGAPGDVDAPGVLLFTTIWATQHLLRKKSMEDACRACRAADSVAGQFRMYGPTGVMPLAPMALLDR